MNPLNSFYNMFGATGVIALCLSLFFTIVALINAWRRKQQTTPPPEKAGPILISDPFSGMPLGERPPAPNQSPNPAAEGTLHPKPQPPPSENEDKPAADPKTSSLKSAKFFRQLDARGLDVEPTGTGKHDESQWE